MGAIWRVGGKKVHHRENPGYAYAGRGEGRGGLRRLCLGIAVKVCRVISRKSK